MTWWIIRDMENCRFLRCLKIILMRANHLWWKKNLSFLLKMVAHFLKKCMIPLPWNQPMRKVLHFFGRCMFLPLWIIHIMKNFHFLIISVSWFILLHPTLPYFAAFILMKYGWKVFLFFIFYGATWGVWNSYLLFSWWIY